MAERPISIRIPETTRAAVAELSRRERRDFSSVVNELLEEAMKMRRIPGVVFADEHRRREAKIAGTGLGVWEVVAAYKRLGEDWERFRQAYDWLNEFQLRAALAYWRAFPEEIEEQISASDSWTEETLYARYPFMRPPEASRRPVRPIAEH
jgi:uncharacterized protein (DUF433 family)